MVTYRSFDREPWFNRLYLPTYSLTQAAKYAGAGRTTVSNWYRHRNQFGPALPRMTPRAPLSYIELIEVAVVATFRAQGVSLKTIRSARRYLTKKLGFEHPFAQLQLRTDGAHILLEWREDPEEEIRDRIVRVDESGQIAWETPVEQRFEQFTYLQDLAIAWRPWGPGSRIVIDPRVAFGAPNVKGIATWAIKERVVAGEPIPFVAEDYGLEEAAVREALLFEGVAS